MIRVIEFDDDETISPSEFKRIMEKYFKEEDTEDGHRYADALMLKVLRQFGYGEGCDIFDAAYKWYA